MHLQRSVRNMVRRLQHAAASSCLQSDKLTSYGIHHKKPLR